VWNGGPRGHLRDSTRAYGERVRVAMENRTVKQSLTVAGKTKRKEKR
jgi:hypothetical protein